MLNETAQGITWDLTDLYAGLDDPAIEKDLTETLGKALAFEKTYRQPMQAGNPDADVLLAAVRELEGIGEQVARVMAYAHLLFAADTLNPRHGAFLQSVLERVTEIRRHLLFFELAWVALPNAKAQALMSDPGLAHFRHYLEHQRQYKPHVLSEPEEKILDEKANTGARAFSRLFDESLGGMRFRVRIQGKLRTLTEQEVLALLHDPDREVRRAAAKGFTRGIKANARLLNFIFNTLVLDHAGDDRLRRFPDPMASRHLENEITPEAVEALLSACEAGYDLVIRYYRLKRRILGLESLYDYDRYAPILRRVKPIPWPEARETVLDAFGKFSDRVAGIAGDFFKQRWIDAEVRPGKQGGAFSHGTVPSVHPYILMNYTGRPRDVQTLAHELGHGVHQFLARPQGYLQMDTPLTLAETASVFGEMLVFHALKNRETDPRTRLGLLCAKLEDAFATVFRQVAMTRFEQALHRARREHGELPPEEVGKLWMDTQRPMFGDAVVLTRDYTWWWLYIPHFIHSPFYCYAYAFGELLVLAIYRMYEEEGAGFVPRYLDLLSAGGSDSPERLLKKVGVDLTRPDFWHTGLRLLQDMLEEAEGLTEGASK